MKTKSKALLLALCAAALVVATVFGTMAYLTDTKTVTNTFTVGSVNIKLDEADVDETGEEISGASRVTGNEYKLIPGHTYTKDPIVHVDAGSENSWIFVKVENGLAAYEADVGDGYAQIATQITTNGWTELDGADGVYYNEYTSYPDAEDFKVFDEFKIAGDANKDAGRWAAAATAKITITAYAVQMDGFKDDPAAAWNVVNG